MPALTLGVGALGISDIAVRKFIPALRASGCARLVAAGTEHPQKEAARSLAAESVDVTTYAGLLAREDVRLVYISLPNHLHEEWTIRALAAGKHVLCEKPLAPTLDAVERMTAAARAANRLLYEGVMFLHHPQHAAVRQLVASGTIGNVRLLRAAFGFHLQAPDNFRFDVRRGGGACNDLLIYMVSAANLFLEGNLVSATGYLTRRGDLDVAAQGVARTSAGGTFCFSIGMEQQYESFYELVGEIGSLRLDRAFTTPPDMANTLAALTGSRPSSIPLPPADHFAEMIRHVCGLVARGAGDDAGCERMLGVHRQIDLIKRSLEPVNR